MLRDGEIVSFISKKYREMLAKRQSVDFRALILEGVSSAGYTGPELPEAMARIGRIFNKRRSKTRKKRIPSSHFA